MMKLQIGNEPKNGTVIDQTRSWVLFDKHQDGDWQAIKLVSKVPRRRANYTLAWSDAEMRLAINHDAVALNADLPEMYDWVVGTMRLQFALT